MVHYRKDRPRFVSPSSHKPTPKSQAGRCRKESPRAGKTGKSFIVGVKEPTETSTGSSARILVVDDEAVMRAAVRQCLEAEGHRVLEAEDGARGLELVRAEKPALIILDVAMPVLGGLEVAAELRRQGDDTPILMLTTRQEVPQRVSGLMAGADDYLGKPFDRRELLARVFALLRRQKRQTDRLRVLHFGPVTVDLDRKTAFRVAQPVTLTQTEFALLELLADHPGQPVSRDLMLDAVWGYTYLPTTRTVDTHVWRLRKKLGDSGENPRWIKKVQGEGYLLAPGD